MARRKSTNHVFAQPPVPTQEISDRHKAALHLRTLLSTYDLAEFQAQTHSARMVDILAAFADDVTRPDDFRRVCANDVLNRAYGTPTQKAKIEFHDPRAKGESGSTIGEEIEAAKVAAEMFQRMNDLTMRRVPMSKWPEDVKRIAESTAYTFND
jgi:hypothetical protein